MSNSAPTAVDPPFPSHDQDSTAVATVPQARSGRAIATLVLAFAADPVMRYWMPEAHSYLEHFPTIALAFGGRAFEHGTAHTAGIDAGAALWLPPGVEPDEQELIASFACAVPDEKHPELFAVAEQMDSYHISEPHRYLPLIGVDPAHQGSGVGSSLMEYALRQCDVEGVPAYLESTNPMNLSLYERFGFEVLGTIRVGDVPTIFPMLRQPRGTRESRASPGVMRPQRLPARSK